MSPTPMGLPACTVTIGIVLVARRAAMLAATVGVTMMSGLLSAISRASTVRRSTSPSAYLFDLNRSTLDVA